jgi:hypothetical protein
MSSTAVNGVDIPAPGATRDVVTHRSATGFLLRASNRRTSGTNPRTPSVTARRLSPRGVTHAFP